MWVIQFFWFIGSFQFIVRQSDGSSSYFPPTNQALFDSVTRESERNVTKSKLHDTKDVIVSSVNATQTANTRHPACLSIPAPHRNLFALPDRLDLANTEKPIADTVSVACARLFWSCEQLD